MQWPKKAPNNFPHLKGGPDLRRARPFSVAALFAALPGDSIAAMNRIACPLAASVLTLAGCNSSTDGADPGPVTQEEAEALEDAASMLEEQRMPEETPDPESAPPEGESE